MTFLSLVTLRSVIFIKNTPQAREYRGVFIELPKPATQ